MKKLMLLLAAGCFAISANAQKVKEQDVPDAIKNSFKKMQPGASPKWEKEKGNYEAEFDVNKVETSLLFGQNGQLLETEMEINVSELPKAASDYVAKNIAGKKIKEASKITDDKNAVTYEAEVEGTDYIFDANGAFIRSNKN